MVLNKKSVLEDFKKSRRIVSADTEPVNQRKKRGTASQSYRSPYESFLNKYADLGNKIDTFTTRDLLYYFRKVAEENGYKYVIANYKKDMHIFKKLRENFDNRTICAMVEFLYTSEQKYLDKERLSPNVLASNYINSIYPDTLLWLDDKYSPSSYNKKDKRENEWKGDTSKSTTSIGSWD